MITEDLLESALVGERPRGALPWFLVAASVMLACLLLYLMFAAYLPLKQRAARLELELRDVYRREADLQTALAREEKRKSQRDRQIVALSQERNELARRVQTLQRDLQAARQRAAAPPKSARRR
jgi:septal ring factor EnvC (AmiA/AmiB activator)